MTNRELIGNIVNIVKEQQADTRLSKKTVWFSLFKTASKLISRDLKSRKLWKQSNIWKPICVPMKEISTIECTCVDLDSDCTIMKSAFKLPKLFYSELGPAIYSVRTLDGSKEIVITTPSSAANNSKVKGVSTVYGFVSEGYLYIVKKKYQMVVLKGLFEVDVTEYNCNYEKPTKQSDCILWLDQELIFPQSLIDDISKIVEQELLGSKQMTLDTLNNKNANAESK